MADERQPQPAEPPPTEEPDEEPDARRVEVTLLIDEVTYASLAPALDRLLAEYDLAATVRRS
jgi:hypothetical protein